MRRVPTDGIVMGASAPVPGLRSCWLLRLLARPARSRPSPLAGPPARSVSGSWRLMGLLLPRRHDRGSPGGAHHLPELRLRADRPSALTRAPDRHRAAAASATDAPPESRPGWVVATAWTGRAGRLSALKRAVVPQPGGLRTLGCSRRPILCHTMVRLDGGIGHTTVSAPVAPTPAAL